MLRAIDQPDAAAIMQEVRTIVALPMVRTLAQLPGTGTTRAGFQATLWCYAGREHGGCGKKIELGTEAPRVGARHLPERARLAHRQGRTPRAR